METDKDESHLTKLFYFQKGQEKKKKSYLTNVKMGVIQGKGKDIRRGGKKKLKSVFGLQDQDRNRSAHFSPGSGHWTRLPWRVHFRPDLLRKKPGEVR